MSTYMSGFQSFFSIFATFCISQIIQQQHKGLDGQIFVILGQPLYCTFCYYYTIFQGPLVHGNCLNKWNQLVQNYQIKMNI